MSIDIGPLSVCSCALDFTKAFDIVEHGRLWEALLEQDVGEAYVAVLADLY